MESKYKLKKQLEECNQNIYSLLFHDSITGLCNERQFFMQGNVLLENQYIDKRAVLISIEIDKFSLINNLYGNTIGEYLLQQLANILKQLLPDQGICCRIVSSQFVLFFSIEDRKEVLQWHQKLLQTLELDNINKIDTHKIKVVTVATFYPQDGENLKELYQNVNFIRNNIEENSTSKLYIFNEKLRQSMLQKQELLRDLPIALKENQFTLYYQPKIDLKCQCVIGMEALLRWNHPTKGFIMPDAFIHLLEETGGIVLVDIWVLEQACIQLKTWQDKGYKDYHIAVNLSSKSFYQPNLLQVVDTILDATGIDGKYIQIELTETMLLVDIVSTIKKMHDLKKRGIQIALDDFGTGYSSLSYLEQLPIDILKIDRSFVREIEVDERRRHIVRAIIALAKALQMTTVTEGIENKKQESVMASLGGNIVQGYLYGKPEMPERVEKLFLQN